MGIELELAALFAIVVLGTSFFGRFEAETAAWRKVLRWMFAAALTLAPYAYIGHWSLAVLGGFCALGLTVHFTWCARNGIDPFSAEPRRRYYELRGWRWPES